MSLRPRSFDDASALEAGVEELLRRFDALTDQAAGVTAAAVSGISGEPAFLVAAADATAETKAVAHFLCDGVDDHVEMQTAVTALTVASNPGFGPPLYSHRGRVILSEGSFWPALSGGSVVTVTTGVALLGSGPGTALMTGTTQWWDFQVIGSGLVEIGDFAVEQIESE
jgi:hypothetical protein